MTDSERYIRSLAATIGLSSLRALEEFADVAPGTVAGWCRRAVPPRGPQLRRVAMALGVDSAGLGRVLAADRKAAQ